ncbi:hypothetical protein J9332_45475, partial [Aquimarina celericrescens]|nr:hypothetical protein [Aquimarina celericrescens]
ADQQYVEINFSDPLKKNQNFNGLVTISGESNLKYTVNGNVLKVYPKQELKGTLDVTDFEGIQSTDNYKLKNTYTGNI